jgi:Ca2+-binding RTX toxin-like protein
MADIAADTTITSNIVETTADGVRYTANDVDVIIAANLLVTSRQSHGVNSLQSNSTLINNGNIVAGDFTTTHYGVSFLGTGAGAITNNKGASITAHSGIIADNGAYSIVNHGTISGMAATGVLLASDGGDVLTNDGEIFGQLVGVGAGGNSTDGGLIQNSGLIHSTQYGIQTANTALTTTVQNSAGGMIRGDVAAIHTIVGILSLSNRGTLVGGIDCEDPSAPDVVINRGKIIGDVHLGGGADIFNSGRGACGAIFGENGDDRLISSRGKNIIVGGLDKDTMSGGAGADKFVFDDLAESAVGANRDLITDFQHNQHDKIDLHSIDANVVSLDEAFHFIGSSRFHHTAGELRYANHILQGDVDGDGTAEFQIHVNAAHLVKADFVL